MTETDTQLSSPQEAENATEQQPDSAPHTDAQTRQGRRFSVGSLRGKARARVRYIEGNHPAGGCRFLG